MSQKDYFEAYDAAWIPLSNSLGLVALLSRLEPTGVLDRLRTPTSAAEVGERVGLDADTTGTMLEALELFGVVERRAGSVVLTSTWLALTHPAGFQPLRTLIAGQEACSSVLRDLSRTDYWDLSSEDRLALARAASPDPYSDGLVEAYRAGLEADRVGQEILKGGRFLELGCGVAGRILLTLRASPELTAVGIELSEDLAAEAERRAVELGLADRFTVICGDAGEFVADEGFDHGFWSQFFFPDHARTAALKVMMASLKPGGSFQAPVGADPDAAASDPEAAKENALWHTMLRSWKVPERTVAGLRAEIEDAGFTDVEVIAREVGPAVRGWKPA